MQDLYIVSDLHLGRGKNPSTGRFYELEAFFYDEDFASFCRYLCEHARARESQFKLIINGDAFDLLRLDKPRPSPNATMIERQYGPVANPANRAADVVEILEGHPRWVQGLARVLAEGHEVVFLPGNHDIEIQWKPVQNGIRRAIVESVRQDHDDEAADRAEQNLQFLPWFYYEPGRIWVEHGCQYDAENAFQYPLRGALAESPAAIHEIEYDMPLGNFFQRYLYNAFGSIAFIVPTARAYMRYFRWLVMNQPRYLARIVASHAGFWLQLIRRFARAANKAREELQRVHEQELESLATSTGLGDALRAIDGLKKHDAGVAETVSTLGRQTVKVLGVILMAGALAVGLWFLGFHAISELRSGFIIKAILFLSLDFAFVVAILAAVARMLLRSPKESSSPLRNAAADIARRANVRIVCFGHTHDEVLWRLDRGGLEPAWYYNTGTWLAVFTHDVLMPRERLQFTFLRVEEDTAELMHWSPGRGQPLPVILLDERDPLAEPRRGAAAQPG